MILFSYIILLLHLHVCYHAHNFNSQYSQMDILHNVYHRGNHSNVLNSHLYIFNVDYLSVNISTKYFENIQPW